MVEENTTEHCDGLGDLLPPGYVRWTCEVCSAVCHFEAMQMCVRRRYPGAECPHDRDQPESNGGAFGFMVRKEAADA